MAQLQSRDMWRRIRLIGLLGLLVGLVGLLVFELWYRPVQTPLVAIVAPAYSWPLPPQAFAEEDIVSLGDLDHVPDRVWERHGSIHLLRVSPAWHSTESGMADFDRQLRAAAQQSAASGTVILYVSMIGVVDSAGRPALIPPGASPLRSETWLPLADVLEHIKSQQLPDGCHKLLVLDCNRVSTDWSLGVLANGFAGRLRDAVRQADVPNLVVLNSAASGQRAWASADLGGSVFAHFLRLGLAGAADSTAEGGNGDRRVSLHELVRYLDRHVDGWVHHNRADHQQPLLVPASAADFTVAWALYRPDQETLAHAAGAADPNISAAALNKLWQAHDRLVELQPLRFDPLAWSQFERKLLWLEQAALAGPAYRTVARATLRQEQDFVARVDQQTTNTGVAAGLLARADVFREHSAKRTSLPSMHALALAQLLGDSDPQRLTDLRTRLDRVEKTPTQPSIAATLADLPPGSRAEQFVEFYFLRLLNQQLPQAAWQQPVLVSKALTVSDHGDRAAVSGDQRGERWTLPLVAAGNRARRTAVDQMLLADDTALAAATQAWDEAQLRFVQADTLATKVATALALRDRAWGEVPYLARWLARALPADVPADSAAALDAEINGSLLPLIRQAHALDAALAAGPTSETSSADSPVFEQQASEVQQQLTHLEELLAKECGRLEALRKGNAVTLRQVDAALALPIIPASQRETLRKLSGQFASLLNAQDSGSTDAKTTGSASTKSSAAGDAVPESALYLERCLVRWQEHPALAILADDEPDAAPTGQADKVNSIKPNSATAHGKSSSDLPAAMVDLERRLRERLEGLPGTLNRLRDAGTGDAEESPHARGDELARAQAARTRAERLARAAAAIGLPPLDDDPIRRLRQWDVQQLLLWHCRRVLDDFWGPAAGQEQPLFAAAAGDYLRGAQAVGEADAAVLAEINRLAKTLEARRQAAAGGLRTEAADVLLVDENEPVQVKMAVEAGPDEAVRGLPPGRATVFLRDSQGRIPGTSRARELPLPAGAHVALDQAVPGSALAGRGPALDAVALFRGNQFTSPLLLHELGGLLVDFKPYRYGSPQVTLGGRGRRRASIMFILDCSNSMSEPTELEGPGGTQKLPRLEAARIALREMLSQLADEGDARVGVIAYGHRVGWNLKKPSELLRQSDYARQIPDDLRPSEDVEVLLPLGRFDQIVASGVYDTLKSLKPWGETPLYLSLIDAINQFDNDEPGTEKSIIVITDGVNYQFNSPSPKLHDDVLQAMGDRKIAIDILGFAISDKEAAQAAKDFGTLATQTGGSYASVSDGTTLVRSLESLLGPKGYEVRDADGTVVGHAPLGTEITIRPKPLTPQTYLVSLGSIGASLELAGGEAAQLLLSGDGRTIHAEGYELEDPQFGALLLGSPGTRTPWRMGVHRPVRDASGVRLTFSVQRTDGQFAARPANAWIEVTPKADDRRTQFPKYIFYDANYEPGTTAPVLKWLAADWPTAARAAEVRGWFKTEATKPGWIVKLTDVADRVPQSGTGATLAGLTGYTYQVRTRRGEQGGGYRVAVVERYGAESAGVGSLKLELFPTPARVMHRFDWQNHLVTHTFYLDETDEQALAGYELRFTRRDDIQQGALQLLEPIVRNVSDSSDVIRPTAQR